MRTKNPIATHCPLCQGKLKTVFLHQREYLCCITCNRFLQCATCGQIIDDCCQGEVACELDTQTQAVVFTE